MTAATMARAVQTASPVASKSFLRGSRLERDTIMADHMCVKRFPRVLLATRPTTVYHYIHQFLSKKQAAFAQDKPTVSCYISSTSE